MEKFLIEESGYYRIRMEVEAKDEDETKEKVCDYLPGFVNFEPCDIRVTEVEE